MSNKKTEIFFLDSWLVSFIPCVRLVAHLD